MAVNELLKKRYHQKRLTMDHRKQQDSRPPRMGIGGSAIFARPKKVWCGLSDGSREAGKLK